ncbi:MAG: sigma-70 family RNA polymerase sigma factor [Deltaproteobacteria bacterium]|nr:sigma-70 family RNA polymerase sigma factor [Deltaproteobacteria bacterium]
MTEIDGARGSRPAPREREDEEEAEAEVESEARIGSAIDVAPAFRRSRPSVHARHRHHEEADAEEVESEEDDSGSSSSSSSSGSASSSVVVDVTPSLGSLPALVSRPSVPALLARDGVRTPLLERFLAEMGRYPLLSREEEDELTMRYYREKDTVAARKLVVHNLRLVVKMAYKYRRAWASVLDLIQEGNVGLVEAVRRFDPFKGAKFSTYATFWIRAYMLRYLLEHSRMVRISGTRVGRKLFFQLSRERERLRALGVEPGPKLLAERLGVDEAALEDVVRHMDQAEVRLDAPVFADEGSSATILDGLANDVVSPEAAAYRAEMEGEVGAALESFAATLTDPREKAAWAEHLMAEDAVSLSDLGARFGVTKQRMGQIVNGIRKRLKAHLIQRLGPGVELGFSLDLD